MPLLLVIMLTGGNGSLPACPIAPDSCCAALSVSSQEADTAAVDMTNDTLEADNHWEGRKERSYKDRPGKYRSSAMLPARTKGPVLRADMTASVQAGALPAPVHRCDRRFAHFTPVVTSFIVQLLKVVMRT